MNDYFQYVHNLKGVSQYERFRPATRDAILSVLLRQLEDYNTLEKAILKVANKGVLDYISEHLDLKTLHQSIILSTDTSSFAEEVDFNNVQSIVNLRRVNYTQQINELFRAVNKLLPDRGIYIGRVETYNDRKKLIFKQAGRHLGQLLWYVDFLIHRVVPRLRMFEKLYHYLTKSQFHAISNTEILGRLVYCGFDIVDIREIDGLSYFVARKVKEPMKKGNPSNYLIVKLNRVGKNGKMVGVYKFRTMHPYSEFLQEYWIRKYGYNDKGKPANDFRVTRWGSFMRKLWLDEVPQIINVIRGEMKLVGLRPISMVRFQEFPEDMQRERIKYKPGCFPPYVALNMPDDKGNIEAERIYIRDLQKHPYITDLRYLLKAVYNIAANKIRSS
ncbi:MAG: sugar transferase [Bacteroidales bacterium]|nr:sugar transferase [Bacteroidales bacterium]